MYDTIIRIIREFKSYNMQQKFKTIKIYIKNFFVVHLDIIAHIICSLLTSNRVILGMIDQKKISNRKSNTTRHKIL